MDQSRRCDGLDDCQDESDELFCCKSSSGLRNAPGHDRERVEPRIALAARPLMHGLICKRDLFVPQPDPRRPVGAAALCILSLCATVRRTAATEGTSSTAPGVGPCPSAASLTFDLWRTETLTLCSPETACSPIRYECRSGRCLLKKNAKCDGVVDCQDGSDEADCGETVF